MIKFSSRCTCLLISRDIIYYIAISFNYWKKYLHYYGHINVAFNEIMCVVTDNSKMAAVV